MIPHGAGPRSGVGLHHQHMERGPNRFFPRKNVGRVFSHRTTGSSTAASTTDVTPTSVAAKIDFQINAPGPEELIAAKIDFQINPAGPEELWAAKINFQIQFA